MIKYEGISSSRTVLDSLVDDHSGIMYPLHDLIKHNSFNNIVIILFLEDFSCKLKPLLDEQRDICNSPCTEHFDNSFILHGTLKVFFLASREIMILKKGHCCLPMDGSVFPYGIPLEINPSSIQIRTINEFNCGRMSLENFG